MEIKKNIKRICTLLLRFLALTAPFSAAIAMGTSHEKVSIFSISFEAKYSYSPALKYFVITNVIASIYGFVVLFVPPKNLFWRIVIVPDLVSLKNTFIVSVVFGCGLIKVVTLLLISSISAALAIGQVGKKGNSHAGWLPICDLLHNYCHQVTGAIAAAFIGIILYLVLLFCSFYSLLYPLFV